MLSIMTNLATSPLLTSKAPGLRPLKARRGPPKSKSLLALASVVCGLTLSLLAGETQELDQLRAEVRGRGWLAFGAKTDAGDWDLFVMRPDGSERQPITRTAEYNEAGPRFSHDGKRLLYYRMPKAVPVDLGSYGTAELVLANADGSEPVVYGKEYRWASWGPEGRQLACLAQKEIQIVDVATRAVVRRIPRKGLASQLLWSPDGKKFIGKANGLGAYWNIGCLDVATGQIVGIGDPERYNCTPDYTADSRRIVYAHGIVGKQPGRAELWVGDVGGTERHRLYALPDYHIYGACASPDGEYLLFTRSVEDLGQPKTTRMGIIRWLKAVQPADTSSALRLDLGPGFEPFWTAKEVVQ
jgi:Tol biopolymer transport system component